MTELSAIARERGIRHFLIAFTDLFGTLRAKLVPARAIEDMARDGAGFAGFATWLDMTPADPDMLAIPDPATLIQLPWKPEVGWMAADLHMAGAPVEQAPRTILRRQIARAAEQGLEMRSGVEPEFFLIQPDGQAIADAADHQPKPCYDQLTLMRRYDVITEICDAMETLGWEPYQNDHEDANGQYEMNWAYAPALVTADRHVFFKYMVRTIAEKHGLRATFMPKPFAHLTGSGCHVHVSLWRNGRNTFMGDDAGESTAVGSSALEGSTLRGSLLGGGTLGSSALGNSPLGSGTLGSSAPAGGHPGSAALGLSAAARHALGGVLAYAEALCALTNPTVNSYKRLNAPVTLSGATWSPNRISWGGNNRTHMIRIPAPGRFECRLGDGSANPYLLQAALLAACLDGQAQARDPGPPLDVNMYQQGSLAAPPLPANLLDAIRAFEASPMPRAAFGEALTISYARMKRHDWDAYMRHLTQWERETTLDI